ncbi:hypothetical protein [Massilia genomosp. 1]|uniref:Uncharacterized protein n=1 Tax=Massilia genomosp. 1 TaxID=2609280 RepID=A0ABX0MKH0_9BURK|nr:hypothetical protein [Massilia genomosp. 1]NHZ62547.1 hypothetical protein [Massilia genomosp. 1]
MTSSRHAKLKLTVTLCFAILVALSAWLAVVLLSQLALMEPVTDPVTDPVTAPAPAAQSLADNRDALRFAASGTIATGAEASYATARGWVWFCIAANGAGVTLLGLWLRAGMSAPPAPARRLPATLPAPRGDLIERAMQRGGAHGARIDSAARAALPGRPAAPASCSTEAAARLAHMTRIIDKLAFQTTLLAVNAAVEAQRGSRIPPHP